MPRFSIGKNWIRLSIFSLISGCSTLSFTGHKYKNIAPKSACDEKSEYCGAVTEDMIAKCQALGHGDDCKKSRWPKQLYEEVNAPTPASSEGSPTKNATLPLEKKLQIPPPPASPPPNSPPPEIGSASCEVIIAGGSTAALFAALTSAREGASTCLLEPTDWPGGQLTASGVPAVDFPWHTTNGVSIGALGKKKENVASEFWDWLTGIGNPGGCWVSRYCFQPKVLLEKYIEPAIAAEPRLKVFRNTVIKSVETTSVGTQNRIIALKAIQRFPKSTVQNSGFDVLLSEQLRDWYSPNDSERFKKKVLNFGNAKSPDSKIPIFIDATEWGELLSVSKAAHVVGVEKQEGRFESDESCGQATVFPFVIDLTDKIPEKKEKQDFPAAHPDFYGFGSHTWEKIWTYRRIKGDGGPGFDQYSLQNWNPGNDFGFGYLFLSRAESEKQISDWEGGINIKVLGDAESHALGWYTYFTNRAPESFKNHLVLNKSILGTSHGLSKVPYIRDTKRSIGIDNFVMTSKDMLGEGPEGTKFADRIGIGAYAMDIHGLAPHANCKYPDISHSSTLPFYISLRSATNSTYENLLVAGKTMAQTFTANSATRLHPIEVSGGIGTGVAAAFLAQNGKSSSQWMLNNAPAIQQKIKKYAPLDWTF